MIAWIENKFVGNDAFCSTYFVVPVNSTWVAPRSYLAGAKSATIGRISIGIGSPPAASEHEGFFGSQLKRGTRCRRMERGRGAVVREICRSMNTKAAKATTRVGFWFHFDFSFVKSSFGKPEWGVPPSLSINKGVELKCSD